MIKKLFAFVLLLCGTGVYAHTDSVVVPLQRQLFHDKIKAEQKLIDKADGKQDGEVRPTSNPDVNLAITDVIMRRVNLMRDFIELNTKLPSNNQKVRYLSYVESMLRSYRLAWRSKLLNPSYAPLLVDNFEKIMNANIDSMSMTPLIEKMPYEVARINVDIFTDNKGYAESKKKLYIRFCQDNPDKILQTIEPYAGEDFADTLIVLSCRYNPTAIYSAAQATGSTVGKLIHRNTDPLVKTVVNLSQTPNALLYFPFLDDIIKGRKSIDDIKKYVGDGETAYDSVGYFKLLVATEIAYFRRMAPPLRDTPIAMFGPNGLREMLQGKAIQHFITPINELHEKSEAIRMKAVDPLSSIDLYYMIVTGESEIYTSSYKHSFNRLIQRLGKSPRTDSLLMNVNFDYFKRFIKMAANYNKLDTFLKLMPPRSSETLMKAFVANLDNTGNLEDAVDVADSYSSISNKKLQQNILNYVKENESRSIQNNNKKGKTIYGLLKTIFLSADSSNKIDLVKEIGIPSIYTIDNKDITDDSGRVVEQVFFYGDDDGKLFFNSFVNAFSDKKQWQTTMKKEWVEIKSVKGQKVWIFANRPLDSDANLDDSAQVHLNSYLSQNDIYPSVVTHRGHSYWLPRTLKRMPDDARIVILGSCGGYKNLSRIISSSPDAHIISTKEIGKGDINQPITNYINQVFLSGKTLVWKSLWSSLDKYFAGTDKDTRESWDDYIPPYRNLGAIFIKAYNKNYDGE
jgi:hypothetical protein